MQNNLSELLALLSFMLPRVFPPLLSESFATEARSRRSKTATPADQEAEVRRR